MHAELRSAYRKMIFDAGFADASDNALPIFFPNESEDTSGSESPADMHLRVDILPVDNTRNLLQVAVYTQLGSGDREVTRLKDEICNFFSFGKDIVQDEYEFSVGNAEPNVAFIGGGFWIQPVTIPIRYEWKCGQ